MIVKSTHIRAVPSLEQLSGNYVSLRVRSLSGSLGILSNDYTGTIPSRRAKQPGVEDLRERGD